METTLTQVDFADIRDFSDVNETGLLMLYARAMESRSDNPILVDKHAERIVEAIDEQIAGSNDPFLSMLYNKKVDERLVVHAALRAQKYDQYAQAFLDDNPDGPVINLGCGLDTRFQRIDDGDMIFFDLDLPEVIGFKRQFLQDSTRYQMIAASVFETGWMDQVASAAQGRVLFLAEGLFMYLEPNRVKALVLEMQRRFPGSELVCEVTNKAWISGIRGKLTASKMQRQLKIGGGAQYQFGLERPDEMEAWNAGIEFLERWSYFDTDHPKLGWMRVFGDIELFRGVQYTVRYRLNPAP
ncbi:MAG: class I SAM-dependent methyltransferase [Chloroflexota bacterium]|jgi:methyltransferase (TIGR00027 family)